MGEGRALYNLGNVYHAKGQSYTQRVNKPPSQLMQRLAVAIVFLKGEETAIPGLKSVLSGTIIYWQAAGLTQLCRMLYNS